MHSKLLTPHRYQLNKESSQILRKKHPWIFRSHVSTAANIFKSGQFLNLVDTDNKTLGFGIYDPDGLIAIRVLQFGNSLPSPQSLKEKIAKALAARENLRKYTNAFRVLNGENDGFPGIIFDVYNDTGVLQTYSSSVDTIGRYCAIEIRNALNLKSVVWKMPSKRIGPKTEKEIRVLYGTPSSLIPFQEGKDLTFKTDIFAGQKSGVFLDLRGLRKFLSMQNLKGKSVLNLFSYTGTLGLCCEIAGADKITQMDISQDALDFAKKNHTVEAKHHRFLKADIFREQTTIAANQQFDWVIVDPPQMTSKIKDVPVAINSYRKIYSEFRSRVRRGGYIVACCCTGRISRQDFKQVVQRSLGQSFKFVKDILPEDDHPVRFNEGDYLKVLVFKSD